MQEESKAIEVRREPKLIHISKESIESVRDIPHVLNVFYKSILQEGTDYGTLPGATKPSLWKPGAELLSMAANLYARKKITDQKVITESGKVFFLYEFEVALYKLEDDHYVGSGSGVCNSKETKYAFRWVSESKIPSDVDKTKLQSEKRRGQYGEYTVYRVATSEDELFSLQNTILKIAEKRAYVDAVLSVTGASRIFTQDLEDSLEEPESQIRDAKNITPQKQQESPPARESSYTEVVNGLSWWTEDAGHKRREWKQGDSWGFANEKESASQMIIGLQKVGDLQIGSEFFSYDASKKQIIRRLGGL